MNNNKQTEGIKGKWYTERKYGGLAIWEELTDNKDHKRAIVASFYNGLGQQQENADLVCELVNSYRSQQPTVEQERDIEQQLAKDAKDILEAFTYWEGNEFEGGHKGHKVTEMRPIILAKKLCNDVIKGYKANTVNKELEHKLLKTNQAWDCDKAALSELQRKLTDREKQLDILKPVNKELLEAARKAKYNLMNYISNKFSALQEKQAIVALKEDKDYQELISAIQKAEQLKQ